MVKWSKTNTWYKVHKKDTPGIYRMPEKNTLDGALKLQDEINGKRPNEEGFIISRITEEVLVEE